MFETLQNAASRHCKHMYLHIYNVFAVLRTPFN